MNSARRMKSFLEDTKSKYKDDDIYTSPHFVGYLNALTSPIYKRFNLKPHRIHIKNYVYDESIGKTNNSSIIINIGNEYFSECKSRESKFKLILGVYFHEVGHRLFTNFGVGQLYSINLKIGKWFPKEPALDVSTCDPMLIINKAEIEEYMADRNNSTILESIMFRLYNTIEDARIEELLYVLCRNNGRLINGLNYMRKIDYYKHAPSFEELLDMQNNDPDVKEMQLMDSLILTYAMFGRVKGLEGTSTEPLYLNLVKIMDYIDNAKYSSSTANELNAINMILIGMWPCIKNYIDSVKQDLQDMKQAESKEQSNTKPHGGPMSAPGTISGTGQPSSSEEEGFTPVGIPPSKGNPKSTNSNSAEKASGEEKETSGTSNKSSTEEVSGEEKETSGTSNKNSAGEEKEETSGLQNEDAAEDKECNSESLDSDSTEDEEEFEITLEEILEEIERDFEEIRTGRNEIPDSEETGIDETAIASALAELPPPASSGDAKHQKCLDEETGRIRQHHSEVEDSGDGGILTDHGEMLDEKDDSSANELERLTAKMADDEYDTLTEKELIKGLNSQLDTIHWGDIHRGININLRRPKIDDTDKEFYNTVSGPYVKIANETAKKVLPLFEENPPGEMITGKYSGSKYNAGAAVKQDYRYFSKKKAPEDKPSLIVGLRVDESGSMHSQNRAISARATAITLFEFCEKCGIPIAIYGDTTSSGDSYKDNVEVFVYSDYDKQSKNDRYRLLDIKARNGNRDGTNIRLLAERMMKQEADMKLLIIISDGQPASSGYTGDAAENDLKSIVSEYSRKGITFLAAAIGDDKEAIRRIYGSDRFFDITNLNDLPKTLTMLVKRHLVV